MTEFIQGVGDLVANNSLLAYVAVFLGGTLSSANPCVIVTIPLIVGYVGGYAGDSKRKAFLYSVAFVLGLSTTFTILGLVASLAGSLFGDVGWFWKYLAAATAFVMGLQLLGLFKIPIPALSPSAPPRKGFVGAFLLGLLFGVVSSPCATPVLAVILAFVAVEGKVAYGASLLFAYALGHCVLMLLAGTFAGAARFLIESKQASWFSVWSKRTSGVLILLAGAYILLLT
jgi:cytochrome c-type biogenesis protein